MSSLEGGEGQGLVCRRRIRNYSPWYQWMTRLAATTHEDPLPEGRPGRVARVDEGRRARLARAAGADARPRSRSTLETLESVAVRRVSAGQDRLRHRGHHVGAGLPAGPRRAGGARVRPCWPATATVPASPRPSGSSTPTRPTATTPSSWSGRATWCWPPTCAASGSGRTGTPRTTTPATPTWSTPSWRGGTRWPRTCGTCPRCLDVLSRASAGGSRPDRHGRSLLRGHGHVVHGGLRRTGGRRRGQRLLLVVGGGPQDAVEHVRFAGRSSACSASLEHEDLGALIAPRPLLIETGHRGRPLPVPAATESVRRTRLVYDHEARRGPAGARRLRGRATSGTGWRPSRSCTVGSPSGRRGTDDRPPVPATSAVATSGRPSNPYRTATSS